MSRATELLRETSLGEYVASPNGTSRSLNFLKAADQHDIQSELGTTFDVRIVKEVPDSHPMADDVPYYRVIPNDE